MASLVRLDLKEVQETYGINGVETLQLMNPMLEARSLSISFDPRQRIFTVWNSSQYSRETMQGLFQERNCPAWAPKVLEKIDGSGNRLIVLEFRDIPDYIRPEAPADEVAGVTSARAMLQEARSSKTDAGIPTWEELEDRYNKAHPVKGAWRERFKHI